MRGHPCQSERRGGRWYSALTMVTLNSHHWDLCCTSRFFHMYLKLYTVYCHYSLKNNENSVHLKAFYKFSVSFFFLFFWPFKAAKHPYFTYSRIGGSREPIKRATFYDVSQSELTLEFESRFESGNLQKAVQVWVCRFIVLFSHIVSFLEWC